MARTSSRRSARQRSSQLPAASRCNSRSRTKRPTCRQLRLESLKERSDVFRAERYHPPSNDRSHAKWKLLGRAIVGLFFGFCYSPSICSAHSLRIVALSGTSAPGTESGVVFRSFDTPPTLNNRGQTVFTALLSGPGVVSSNERGVWSESGGNGFELIARKGSGVPGAEIGVVFGSSIGGVLSENGQTILQAELDRTSIDNTFGFGNFRKVDGEGLQLIFDSTSHLPGISSTIFPTGHGAFAANSGGQTAYWLTLSGPAEIGYGSEGIWSEGAGNGLQLIACGGSEAISNVGPIRFYDVDNSVIIDDLGVVTFVGTFRYGGTIGAPSVGIWTGRDSSSLRLVARTDTNAPGAESGVDFYDLAFPASNNSGQVAFWGRLRGTNVVAGSNDTGFWREKPGNALELVARTGNRAPGTGIGVSFKNLGTMLINEDGQMAFSGRLTGPNVDRLNDEGIWSEGHGDGLNLIFREGDPAPDTESGVNFGSFFVFESSNSSALAENAKGQIAFAAKLAGVGVDSRNGYGIWAEDIFGRFHLIAREGDMIDVDAGPEADLRRILRLEFDGGGAGGFNDLGQIAYKARFDDGTSGLFVSNLVAVPEPAICDALLSGAIFMCCRRKLRFSDRMHFAPSKLTFS